MQLIEERQRRCKAESHEKYANKLAEIQKKFSESYERCLQRREEKEKLTQEKTFKKYQAYYFIMKEQKEKLEEKRRELEEKNAMKMERFEMLAKEKERKRKAILKKLQDVEKKKELNEKKKEEELKRMKTLFNENKEKINQKQKDLEQKLQNDRMNILYKETNIFNRALQKEDDNYKMKSKAHMSTISDQMSLEEERKEFLKKISEIQDNSVLKKTKKEKINMYKEKLRIEEEERIRQEEERLDAMS